VPTNFKIKCPIIKLHKIPFDESRNITRTDRQTDRRRDRSKEKWKDRRKDRYGEVSRCIPSTFAAQTADTTNLKNQIILGFGRRNPRQCAVVRGQITQLPVNRSLALSNRESRPQPASCRAAARQWGVEGFTHTNALDWTVRAENHQAS
jgi:hypothetical protein